MEAVFILHHSRSDAECGDDAKLIGVYRKDSDARAASERLARQPGFADYPNGWHIDRYVLGQDHWKEGFGLGVRTTTGVIGGETIQIVEGRWPDEVGDGLAVTGEGFDLIEPCLRTACSGWTSEHRYGAFELPPSARSSLVGLLRSEAAGLTEGEGPRQQEAQLLTSVADWLDARSVTVPISILGY